MYYIIIIIIIIDQLFKTIITNKLYPGESIPIINNIFHLTFVRNTGAGFGILPGFRYFFIILTLILAIILLFYRNTKENNRLLDLAVGFVLGGAAGNFIDRVRLSYVVDYLDFRVWPVFNIADSAIVVGVGLLIIYFWQEENAIKQGDGNGEDNI